MTLRELYNEGRSILEAKSVPDAGHDARALLLDTFHISKNEYLLLGETELCNAFPTLKEGIAMPLGFYRDRIRMRAARIPLQQILGEASFMGLDFKVNEFTLCPRPDTEVLCETVLSDTRGNGGRLLDLCTGTGCIGISLAVLGGFTEVTLSDISEEALSVAGFNAEKLCPGTGIRIVKSDLFDAFQDGPGFDVVTANPPYIRDAVIETLEPEVKTFEPRIALSGGEDGLFFYKKIIAEAPAYAKALYLEIGYDQAEPVTALMEKAGFREIRVIRDYGGNDRVVTGRQ